MFCPSCGKELAGDARFCAACGASVRQGEAAGMSERAAGAPSTQSVSAQGSVQVSPAQEALQPKKKKRTGAIVASVVAVAVVAVVAIAAVTTDGFGLLKKTEEVYMLKSVSLSYADGSKSEYEMERNKIGEPAKLSAVYQDTSGEVTGGTLYEYEHDASGNAIGAKYVMEDGTAFSGFETFEFSECDSDGRVTDIWVESGVPTFYTNDLKFAIVYDDDGFLKTIEEYDMNSNNELIYGEFFEGQLLMQEESSSQDVEYWWYEKDANGLPSQYYGTVVTSSGAYYEDVNNAFSRCTSITYDSDGNVSRMLFKDGGTVEYSWERVSRSNAKAHVCSATYTLHPETTILFLWQFGLV